MDSSLKVAAICKVSCVNGPGRRFVLWLQGCQFGCPSCCNPEFQSLEGGSLIKVSQLQKMILSVPNIEGVTYSGGEPFLQIESLIELMDWGKQHGLTQMIYTGYEYEEILENAEKFPFWRRALDYLDLLVCGRYESSKAERLHYRSSQNQKIVLLSDRYQFWAQKNLFLNPKTEVHVLENGEIVFTGFPNGSLVF